MVAFSTKLALNIIEEFYGDITRDVAAAVINTDNPTLSDLIRFFGRGSASKVDAGDVRNALLVLQQHGCLKAELPDEIDVEGDSLAVATDRLKQKGLVYSIDQDMVLHMLRLPKLVLFARSLFGNIAASIIEEVVMSGRVSTPNICRQVALKVQKDLPVFADELTDVADSASLDILAKKVHTVVESLIKRRLLVPVVPLDLSKRLVERKEKVAKMLASVARGGTGAVKVNIPPTATTTVKKKMSSAGLSSLKSLASSPSSTSTLTTAAATVTGRKRKVGAIAAVVRLSGGVAMRAVRERGQEADERDGPLDIAQLQTVLGEDDLQQWGAVREQAELYGDFFSDGSAAAGEPFVKMASTSVKGGRKCVNAVVATSAAVTMAAAATTAVSSGGVIIKQEISEINAGQGQSVHEGSEDEMVQVGAPLLPQAPDILEDTMWTVGWDEFLRQERVEACSAFVRDYLGSVPGAVVRVMLELSRPYEQASVSQQAQSVPVGVGLLREKLQVSVSSNSRTTYKQQEEQPQEVCIKAEHVVLSESSSSGSGAGKVSVGLSAAQLDKVLEMLKNDPMGIVSKVHMRDHSAQYYMVNTTSIVNAMRRKITYSVIVERHGLLSGRIVELLHRRRFIEQQQISEMIIAPAKDTRERLYKLYKEKWVDVLEITRRPDFTPAATSYFWSLRKNDPSSSASGELKEHLCRTIYNLRLRRKHEYQENCHLLVLPFNIPPDSSEARAYQRLSVALDRLDTAVLRVDHTLMIMNCL